MKRKIIIFIFLLSITAGYSQKEIYFSSSKEDSISISSLKYPEIEIASNFVNPFIYIQRVDIDSDGKTKNLIKSLSLFPVMPTFNWSLQF